jgi:class 3 adenylate cyclase
MLNLKRYKLRLIYAIIIFCIPKTIYAEDQLKIDSLNNVLKASLKDTCRVNTLNALAFEFLNSNADTTIYLTNKALSLATDLNYNLGIADAYLWQGVALRNKQQSATALKNCNEALKIYELLLIKEKVDNKNKIISKKARTYSLMAIVYGDLGEFGLAIEKLRNVIDLANILNDKKQLAQAYRNLNYYYKSLGNFTEAQSNNFNALKIYEEINDQYGIAFVVGNIGGIYYENGEYDKALKYYKQSLDISSSIGEKSIMSVAYVNIAMVLESQKKYEDALKNISSALKIEIELDNKYRIADYLTSLGDLKRITNELELALDFYFKSLKIAEQIQAEKQIDVTDLIVQNKINIGETYLKKSDFKNAEIYLNSALKLSKNKTMMLTKKSIYNSLSDLKFKQGNYKASLEYFKLNTYYQDSLFNDEASKNIEKLGMTYEFDKKEAATKAAQEKKDAIALKELQRQKLVRNSFMGGFAIVLLFAGVFFTQRNKIKKGKKLSDELLLNILPEKIADELKEKGSAEAQLIDEVTVLFTDFKGFTQLSEKLTPKELVAEINECFSAFDHIMEKHGVEKIKTIGDAYMAAGGLPTANTTHAEDVVKAALAIQNFMHEHKAKKMAANELFFEIRIGVHTGPVVAGIVGVKKFAYDIWGDTVNTASRMESSGEVGKVNISGTTYGLVKDKFKCVHRGQVQAKGKGEIDMYFVEENV